MAAPILPTTLPPNYWLSTTTAGSTLTGLDTKYNQLTANAGHVTLIGGANGNNTFIVYDDTDTIVQAASAGVNTVETWGYGYTLPVNVQNLTLEGSHNAYAIGNAGNNLLTGNAGNDSISTGGGNDVIVDGTGVDTINFTRQSGTTTWVENFKTSGAKIDQLNLAPYFDSFAAAQAAMTQSGANVQINLGNGQKVMLQNTQLSALTAADVQTGVDLSSLHMTFDEAFNGPLSFGTGTVNTGQNVWNTALGTLHTIASNGEQEVYVDPSYKGLGLNPFSDSNGVMTIQASPTPSADLSALGNLGYTSGMLTTLGTFSQQYGYFEAGIETPAGQGLWPAFWLLPANGSWPPEMDVMEQVDNVAGANTTTYSTTHSNVTPTNSVVSAMPEDLTAGFHSYGLSWNASTITYYVDGQQIGQMATPADDNTPMYLLLDLAVGGNWAGSPDATTNWSTAEMKVDYVRAYSSDPNAPGVATAAATATAGPVPAAASVILSNSADANPTNLASSFAVPGSGPGTSTTYAAPQLDLVGVADTTVTVAHDAANNTTVTNNGAWGSINDVTITDSQASSVTVGNFAGAEITLGAGASTVAVTGIKRGDIKVGDGNNAITVSGGSDSQIGNGVTIATGNGDNTIGLTGTVNDKAAVTVGDGDNAIDLQGQMKATVVTGAGTNTITDQTSGYSTFALGSGSDAMAFLATAHAAITHFTADDAITLTGMTVSQVKVTNSAGSTDIALSGGSIHIAGVVLSAQSAQIHYG